MEFLHALFTDVTQMTMPHVGRTQIIRLRPFSTYVIDK
jgi:hypothetical protein